MATAPDPVPPELDRPEPPAAADNHSAHGAIWRIAWPSVLTFVLMTTNSILDRAFVGRLGRDALAAVGVGGQVLFLLGALAMAVGVGTTALVARFTGARDPDSATEAAGQSAALAFWVALGGTLLIYAALGPLLRLMELEPEAARASRAFLNMALIGTVPMFIGAVLSSAFRGLGDTKTPLKAMLVANVVHIVGDLTLMLGYLGAPRLGVAGGGIAVSASGFVSLAVYLYYMRRSPLAGALSARRLRLTWIWATRVMRIGVPSGIAAFLRTSSGMAFTAILARTSERTGAVAALPIGLTAESIAFMPGLGFSVAASALVGQALGARRPDRATQYGWAAAWQGVGIMTVMGVVFYVAAEPFARIFTQDPVVIRNAVSYLRINAISEPMLGFSMILTGALQGAGDTTRPTIVTGISAWVLRVPLAWFLALHLGMNATGAWLAMAATTVVSGFWILALWRDGKWQRAQV